MYTIKKNLNNICLYKLNDIAEILLKLVLSINDNHSINIIVEYKDTFLSDLRLKESGLATLSKNRTTFNNISVISSFMAISFIGEGNPGKTTDLP